MHQIQLSDYNAVMSYFPSPMSTLRSVYIGKNHQNSLSWSENCSIDAVITTPSPCLSLLTREDQN
jgi:hypothetical protein